MFKTLIRLLHNLILLYFIITPLSEGCRIQSDLHCIIPEPCSAVNLSASWEIYKLI